MKVRGVCGALLGLLVGLGMCVRLWPLSIIGACVMVALAAIVCGLAAVRFGDGFWAKLRWLQ